MLRVILALVAVVIIVVAGLAFWIDRQISPGGKPGSLVSVTIPAGASSSQIGSILAKAGVIHTGSLFRYYVTIEGAGTLYPGTYQLHKNSSYGSVVTALSHPPVVKTDKLTIPEGYTIAQIAAAVAKLPGMNLSAAKFEAAATNGTVRSPYEPPGLNNLEGLVFPATYDVKQGDSETDVLEQMVGAFDNQAQSLGLTAGAAKLGMTPYQVVTVASIVQHEAKLTADLGPTASTIYNRLKSHMALGADSTQTYYLRLSNPALQPSVAQLNTPGPYNTRLNQGLPPTPIGTFSLQALQAAVSPPPTTYLYFVEVNPDGQLGFASDNAGFANLEAQCRAAKLC